MRSEVLNYTLNQIQGYQKAIALEETQKQKSLAFIVRASQFESKDFKEFINSLD